MFITRPMFCFIHCILQHNGSPLHKQIKLTDFIDRDTHILDLYFYENEPNLLFAWIVSLASFFLSENDSHN